MIRKAAISDCKYVLNAYSLLSEDDQVGGAERLPCRIACWTAC